MLVIYCGFLKYVVHGNSTCKIGIYSVKTQSTSYNGVMTNVNSILLCHFMFTSVTKKA